MQGDVQATRAVRRSRFSVPLNLQQVEEVLRRVKLGDDRRSIGDWVEHGLRLALAETMRTSVSDEIEDVLAVEPSGNREIALAIEGLEALLAEEELRAKSSAGRRVVGNVFID